MSFLEAAVPSATSETAGYSPGFLGHRVAVPRPRDRSRELRELTYPRFTVLLDPARRLAAATAVNIDGATLQDVARSGQWRLDDRIPADEQAGNELYRDNDDVRGHLVRRRDPGWGTRAQAREATAATFVYTNAAPQASGFDQSPDLWVGLEDHVLEYADTTDLRVSVFTAPVLDDDDPEYRGVRIPRRFRKIAAWASAARGGGTVLASTGFVLDQTDLMHPTAVAPLGASAPSRCRWPRSPRPPSSTSGRWSQPTSCRRH